MPKTKSAPARKPAKAKGALKAPKTAPLRPPRQWYRRKGFRIVGAVLAAAILLVLVKAVMEFRESAEARRDQAQAVQQFDRRVQILEAPLQEIFQASAKSAGELTAGTLPKDAFAKQAEGWLAEFRKFDKGVRNRKIPAGMDELEDARALYVQAAVTFIDAAKSYQLAATLDPPGRDEAVKQANNLISHGAGAASLGDRIIQRLKIRYELAEKGSQTPEQPAAEPSLPPVQLPAEDAPLAPPPGSAPGSMPGGAPGSMPGGAPPGMPGGVPPAPPG